MQQTKDCLGWTISFLQTLVLCISQLLENNILISVQNHVCHCNVCLDNFSTHTSMRYLLRMLVLRAIMAPGRKGTQQLSPLSWATLQARIQGTNDAQRPEGKRHIVILGLISQCWLISACFHKHVNTYRCHSLHSSRTRLNSNLLIRRRRCTVW